MHKGQPTLTVVRPGKPGDKKADAPERSPVLNDAESRVRFVNEPTKGGVVDGVPNRVDDVASVEGGGVELHNLKEQGNVEEIEKSGQQGSGEAGKAVGQLLFMGLHPLNCCRPI